MTRRDWLGLGVGVGAAAVAGSAVVVLAERAAEGLGLVGPARSPSVEVPVNLIFDSRVKWRTERLWYFWGSLWRQAASEFARSGVLLRVTEGSGEVERPRGREPVISGLENGFLNLVITDTIPMTWDRGLALSGVTLTWRGYHVCMIALAHAHPHQVPLLSTNTCVHELLHALMGDIIAPGPGGAAGQARELRIDGLATAMWVLHYGAPVRRAALVYRERLRPGGPPRQTRS
jgi:hypothetical protein